MITDLKMNELVWVVLRKKTEWRNDVEIKNTDQYLHFNITVNNKTNHIQNGCKFQLANAKLSSVLSYLRTVSNNCI